MMVEQAERKMVELEGDSASLIDRVVKQEWRWPTKEEPCMAPVQGELLPSNESTELPVSSTPHGLGTKNTDQMSTAQGRSSAAMADQVKKDSAGSVVDFVVKLEPLWSAEDPDDEPPAVHSTVQPTADGVSGLLPSLNRSHVCHHCFATFVLVSSLELHIAAAHGEELCVVLPVASSPDGREASDYSRGNTDMVSGGKLVERIKSEVDHNDTEVSGGEKQSRQSAYEVFRKVFTQASDFEEQELIDSSQKRFRCDICNKTFTRAHCLKVHKLIHTGLKPFKCDVCGRAFIRFTLLKSHKLTHTSLNPHVCDVCGKAFTKGEHLKIHKRIHTGERPYKCPHCTSDFKAPCHLKRHVLSIHAGKKPYVCNVCGMGFAVNGHLKRHERIHTGEKPYTCDVCGTEFTQGSHLKKHQKIHTVDKPHICGVCGETFAKNGQLARHKMTHPSENLTCADCGKMFTRTNALKCHRLIHTGEKPHTCPHCPAAFTQSGSLKRHVRNLHP